MNASLLAEHLLRFRFLDIAKIKGQTRLWRVFSGSGWYARALGFLLSLLYRRPHLSICRSNDLVTASISFEDCRLRWRQRSVHICQRTTITLDQLYGLWLEYPCSLPTCTTRLRWTFLWRRSVILSFWTRLSNYRRNLAMTGRYAQFCPH